MQMADLICVIGNMTPCNLHPCLAMFCFHENRDTKDQFLIGLFAVKLLFKGIITESFCNQKANNINIKLEKNKQKPFLGWKKEITEIEDF